MHCAEKPTFPQKWLPLTAHISKNMKAIDVGLLPRCLGGRQGVKFNQKVSLNQATPRLELGHLDSESSVLTTILRRLSTEGMAPEKILNLCRKASQNACMQLCFK